MKQGPKGPKTPANADLAADPEMYPEWEPRCLLMAVLGITAIFTASVIALFRAISRIPR